jgi:hypothetical protein
MLPGSVGGLALYGCNRELRAADLFQPPVARLAAGPSEDRQAEQQRDSADNRGQGDGRSGGRRNDQGDYQYASEAYTVMMAPTRGIPESGTTSSVSSRA